MYRQLTIIFISFFLVKTISGQNTAFNSTLLSHIQLPEDGNDVWGFTDKNGIKYAIIGSLRNTWVYSLENPSSPILRYKAPGVQSIWRDIKSYKDHLYVTADRGTDGLMIIDMSQAPDSISHLHYKPDLEVGTVLKPLERCHNLYIDEKGFAYLAGCNISTGGVLIFDLNTDPEAPPYIGAADLAYSHDAFARGDTLFTSEIYLGAFGVYDISDRAKPVLLARQTTSRLFTHNTWLSDNGKYLFTTDERANAYVDAYDISDLNNIRFLDRFRPLDTENQNVIPHNVHYYNGYLAISWYTDGLRIVDAHKPDNLIEVAYYDTWNDPYICHNNFYGCWGAFPFTDSNIVYAYDINNGLFIVEVDYKRACYLEGVIKNTDGEAISNAKVEIISNQTNRGFSDPAGGYKSGQAESGIFNVKITHPNYQPQFYSVILNHGEVTELDVTLFKKRPVLFSISVTDEMSNSVSPNVKLSNETQTYYFDSNGNMADSVLTGEYNLTVAAWGYKSIHIENYKIEADEKIEFELEKGFEDHFDVDLGWKVESAPAMNGVWIRAIPRGTEYFGTPASPYFDANDPGDFCFVTGNGIPGPGCTDVDNGLTTLISPKMDMTELRNPGFNYSYWLFTGGGSTPPNDTLVFKVSNGNEVVTIQKTSTNTKGWERTIDLKIKDLIQITKEMQLIIEISDSPSSDHIVKAGFDYFFVSVEDIPSSVDDVKSPSELSVFPNPANDKITIINNDYLGTSQQFYITDLTGRTIHSGKLLEKEYPIDISNWNSGLYILKSENSKAIKFIKI